MFPTKIPLNWLSFTLIVLALCTACTPSPGAEELRVEIPQGFQVELYATGLEGPTQMTNGPDGRIWLAQLAGAESEGAGEVIALTRDDPTSREVLLEGLFKPTGIAVLEDELWVAAGRDLLRASLDAAGKPGTPEIIRENLPYNGRSNGTLTVTPDDLLLYETSGRRRGNLAAEGSASLWSLDPADPHQSQLMASGLKNAYAHTFDARGRLWVTEVGDDPVNGDPPPDELNLILPGVDYGWPSCYGKQEPARNYGGTKESCAGTRPAAAVFPPRSTPTSLVPAPWDQEVLLVALWGPSNPSVVRVEVSGDGESVTADDISPFLTGLAHPQSLLVLPDGSLLVSDFESGNIYRISRK